MISFIKYISIALGFAPAAANAQIPGVKPVVINEVLFNPVKDGFDYVEGYNRGTRPIDLSEIYIANRNAAGEIAGARAAARSQVIAEPGRYFVITANENWLRLHYKLPENTIVCQPGSLPSFPDDEGSVIFLDKNGSIIDELDYSEKWHFEMIAEPEGIALERINYNIATQDRNNWTSASSSSGFGTPGFENSHFRTDNQVEGEVIVQPKLFTPGNDGSNDFATITISRMETGWVANLVIYDVAGRRVKYLLKNEILGIKNVFNWYGTDDRLNQLPAGIYILFTELFNLKGEVRKFRNTVIISSARY